MMQLQDHLLDEEQLQAQEKTERELLSSEAAFLVAALLLLRRSGKRRPRTRYHLDLVRRELIEGLTKEVFNGRRRSRVASFDSLLGERGDHRHGLSLSDVGFGEQRRAHQIARRFGDHWGRAAAAAIDEGESLANAPRVAARRQRSRLQMTVITENARAFNEERVRQSRSLPLSRDLMTFKYWNAKLDKRTCSVCSSADGELVRADEPFSEGTPGLVHPRCRCIAHFILLPASAQGRLAS